MTHLKIGDKAPKINSLDQNGNLITLEQYKGKKVVLYFYPKDMTPGCTSQACNLSDNYNNLSSKSFSQSILYLSFNILFLSKNEYENALFFCFFVILEIL